MIGEKIKFKYAYKKPSSETYFLRINQCVGRFRNKCKLVLLFFLQVFSFDVDRILLHTYLHILIPSELELDNVMKLAKRK